MPMQLFVHPSEAGNSSGTREPPLICLRARTYRWRELERRIVLSQYLLAVNEAGSLPPQESGLVNNGWNGKFHMEMYWWHAAHYALWRSLVAAEPKHRHLSAFSRVR